MANSVKWEEIDCGKDWTSVIDDFDFYAQAGPNCLCGYEDFIPNYDPRNKKQRTKFGFHLLSKRLG